HVLAGYLMYRIQYMQRVHKSKRTRTHRTILFSTIYKQIKYTQDKDSVLTKRKMLYYRTLCNDILKTWQNLGLIREFTFHKKKNLNQSIIIKIKDVNHRK